MTGPFSCPSCGGGVSHSAHRPLTPNTEIDIWVCIDPECEIGTFRTVSDI